MDIKPKGEILAPAGNTEMLFAAVRSGADAVYLGAKDFSARRNAENFGKDELKTAVEYCHIRGVKVYLTLNILLKDNELSAAFSLAKEAYNIGVDGIITEDLGLAAIINEKLPDFPLHASTQMSVHSPSALPMLKKLGFKRVVAAREMSKQELEAFCNEAEKLGIEVEVFVHGALCMSMSGQCLLSAFLGSRSGNRGLCAGTCRLPFKVNGGTGYDLSLKDLSLSDYMTELCKIGVSSFKIEGRMKRPEYVAAAVTAVKRSLLTGKTDEELNITLKNVFSRQGFTDGYYTSRLGKDMFGIRTKEDVLGADKAFPVIHELYRREIQSVPITLEAEVISGEPIKVTFSDGENTVTATANMPEKAVKKEISKEDIKNSLTKLGSTPYVSQKEEILLDGGLYVSSGELNALRRTAAELLDAERKKVKRIPSDEEYVFVPQLEKPNKKPLIYARFESVSQIPDNIGKIDAVIYPLEKDPEDIKGITLPLIADIPRGISDERVIEKRLSLFREHGFKTALCGNLAAVHIAQSSGFEIIADTGLNIANSQSLKVAEKTGITSAVISAEQTLEDISKLSSAINKGIVAYGNVPLMLFRNCPLKNGTGCKSCDKNGFITDRLGTRFPVRCRMAYSELLNSVPIVLSDKKEDIKNIDFMIYYFTRESKRQVSEIISCYESGTLPDIKYTRGLYYRGTI